MKFPKELEDLESHRLEPATMLVRAWARSLQESPGVAGPGCLSSPVLYLFQAGVLSLKESRRILLHLSSCSRCRSREYALHPRQAPGPTRAYNLAYLRQAAQQDLNRVRPALQELQAWLVELSQAAAGLAQPPPTLMAEVIDPRNQPAGQAELRWLQPPRIDSQGRLRLKLAAGPPRPGFSLGLAVRDMDYRLNLAAVPLAAETVEIIADGAVLAAPAGMIPEAFIQAAVVPAALEEKWSRPRLLPRLREILAETEDLADRWDALAAALDGQGDRWRGLLASEIMEEPDSLPAGLETLGAVRAVMADFAAVWLQSNGEAHPYARDFLAGMEEIMQPTRQKRKPTVDAVFDATIGPKRPKNRKEDEKIDID